MVAMGPLRLDFCEAFLRGFVYGLRGIEGRETPGVETGEVS